MPADDRVQKYVIRLRSVLQVNPVLESAKVVTQLLQIEDFVNKTILRIIPEILTNMRDSGRLNSTKDDAFVYRLR